VNKRTYTPQPGSLPARVCAFFAEQPDEELEPLDIVTKFDAIQTAIHTQLKKCIEHGLLQIRKVKIGIHVCNVYCAGPKLTQGLPAAAPAAAPATAPAVAAPAAAPVVRRSIDDEPPEAWTASAKRVQGQPPEANATVTDITYEPLVAPLTGAAGGKWSRHLQDLSALPITDHGHPTRRFPRTVGNAVQKAVNSWNKHHPLTKLQARIRGDHTIVQRIA
jgi:hypothetical protein